MNNFASNFFSVFLENEEIYSFDFSGQKKLIGYTFEKFQELENLKETIVLLKKELAEVENQRDEYGDKLIELGILELPKTSEEILSENLEETKKLYNLISGIQKNMENLNTRLHNFEEKNNEKNNELTKFDSRAVPAKRY